MKLGGNWGKKKRWEETEAIRLERNWGKIVGKKWGKKVGMKWGKNAGKKWRYKGWEETEVTSW
jgi:hypothetical protein